MRESTRKMTKGKPQASFDRFSTEMREASVRAQPRLRKRPHEGRARLLIEGTKLRHVAMDGNKRFVIELLRGLGDTMDEWNARPLDINVFLDYRTVMPLAETLELLDQQPPTAVGEVEAAANRFNSVAKQLLGPKLTRSLRYWRDLWRKKFVRASVGTYDLVHVTTPGGLDLDTVTTSHVLSSLHDLSHLHCPELQSASNTDSLERGIKQVLRRDGTFAAISRATRKEMSELLGWPEERVQYVPLACDIHRFHLQVNDESVQEVRAKHMLDDAPYFVYIGTLEPRKNLCNAVAGFRLFRERCPDARIKFAIGGSFGWGDPQPLKKEVARTPGARLLGRVDDEDLAPLYRGALAMIFVSHYEGFGLPPLEAMSCGTPVVYGDNSALPEVVGDGGLPTPATSVEGIADALVRIHRDPGLRDQLADNAVRNARCYSWQRVTRELLDLYYHFLFGDALRRSA